MKRKTILIIGIIVTVLIAGGAYIGMTMFNKKNPDIENLKTDFTISADELIGEFESNDTEANTKYTDKVLEISGPVSKTIPGDSITSVVMDPGKSLTITIEIYSRYNEMAKNLNEGDQVTIKALYIGYVFDPMLAEFGEKGDIKLKKGSFVE